MCIYIHIYIHYIYIHYTYNAYVYNVYVYTYHLEVSSNRATPNHRLLFGRGRVRHGALTGIGTLAEMWDSHRPIYMVFTIEYLCQIPSITIDLWDLPYQNGIYNRTKWAMFNHVHPFSPSLIARIST